MESEETASGNFQETSGNDQESSENDQESSRKHPGYNSELVQLLARRPELRKELIKWVKSEFGFNCESILENYFGELPDKKTKIEDIDMPMREIAENVLQMYDDGYAVSQIASYLGIFPSVVSKVLKNETRWRTEIENQVKKKVLQNKNIPWYIRLATRLKLL